MYRYTGIRVGVGYGSVRATAKSGPAVDDPKTRAGGRRYARRGGATPEFPHAVMYFIILLVHEYREYHAAHEYYYFSAPRVGVLDNIIMPRARE